MRFEQRQKLDQLGAGQWLDAENSIIKTKIARRDRNEIAFPHALRQLSDCECEKILSRNQINGNIQDYFRVNGKPYVVGESAERHGLITQQTGTARCTKKLYGVLAAISLSKLYGRGSEVAVFASRPPGDVKYRKDLMEPAQ